MTARPEELARLRNENDWLKSECKRIANEAVKMLNEDAANYNRLTNDLIDRHGKAISALQARVSELEGAQAWRPIESAPPTEDYAPMLLLWEPHAAGGFMFSGTRNVDGNWVNSIDMQVQNPTHWMAQPAAPSAALNTTEGGEGC